MECNFCGKIGHLQKVCRSRAAQVHQVASAGGTHQCNQHVSKGSSQPSASESSASGEQAQSQDSTLPINWHVSGPGTLSPEDIDEFVDQILNTMDAISINCVTFWPDYPHPHVKSQLPVLPATPEEDVEMDFIVDENPADLEKDFQQDSPTVGSDLDQVPDDAFMDAVSDAMFDIEDILEEEGFVFTLPESAEISLGLISGSPQSFCLSWWKVLLYQWNSTRARESPENLYKQHFPGLPLKPIALRLNGASGPIAVLGVIIVAVLAMLTGAPIMLPLVVVADSPLTSPLGRNWLDVLHPQWREAITRRPIPVYSVAADVVHNLQQRFPAIFDPNNSAPINDVVADITLKQGANSVFHKAYSVPFSLLPIMDEKLSAMIEQDIIYPVKWSQWAPLCVMVRMKDQDYCIAIDPKRTLNPNIEPDQHKLPVLEDIFATMANGCFTVLDLTDAYTQLILSPSSQELLTIHTHRGLFRYKRLVYGIRCAPGLFQRAMDYILQGIPNVCCFIDDILIKGRNFEDCLSTTIPVLERLQTFNVHLRPSKYRWFEPEVESLGHVLSATGRCPIPSKVTGIENMKVPPTVKEVRHVVELVNFDAEYLPHSSTVFKPLTALTGANKHFLWSKECQDSFDRIRLMIHYDPSLPLVLITDASPVGLGVALCHERNENGRRMARPILSASCTLSETQQKYPQVDREALGIIFG